MLVKENTISYETTNTYSTWNNLDKQTKNIWIACHGIGYLSHYFIRYFKHLSANNYVICPQAPSKYYQDKKYRYVGASWLTKVNTEQETENVLTYLDALYTKECIATTGKRVLLMGYSQGVSVCLRWMAKRALECTDLIIHSGSIPSELKAVDFKNYAHVRVHLIYGNEDEYIFGDKLKHQLQLANELFPKNLTIYEFDGKHEVNIDLLEKISKI